jgi:hypothetical protein
MRTINSDIARMIRGRPGPRLWVKVPFLCHELPMPPRQRIGRNDGVEFKQAWRPTAFALRAKRARSTSVNRIRLPRSRPLSNYFSARRNSMTSG